MSAKICPTCGGTRVNCPTCGYPPKRVLPKQNIFSRVYNSLVYGAGSWEVQGIDVSKWNGQMNFVITKTKCQYVIMRLGYGTQWKDVAADAYYRDARAQDIPVGVYWYCNIGVDPALTAQSFADEISTHQPQLDIVIDAETTTLGAVETLNWLKDVDTRLTSLTGKKPVIYTAAWFWNTKVARSSYWSLRDLWVANWTTGASPYMPQDWYAWKHWQWSADGNMKGAEYGSSGGDADMDLDRFNGTVVQFNAKYGTHIQPIGGTVPPVTPPGTLPEYVIINTGELSIRSAPNPYDSTLVIGHALQNTHWYPETLEIGTDNMEWYKVGKKAYIKKAYTRLP